MAKVWLSVTMLLLIQTVFANVCNNAENIRSCDECIRCAGSWCQKPEPGHPHCTMALTDDFCGGHQIQLPRIPSVPAAMKGSVFNPAYAERAIYVGGIDDFHFTYSSSGQRKLATASVFNNTLGIDSSKINDVIDLKTEEAECEGNVCTQLLETKVYAGICKRYSTIEEFLYVKIKVENLTEEVIVKYHVPCACECSKKMELKSPLCSGHGDFACGACNCFEPWTGEDCSQHVCGKDRGDDQCTSPFNRMECSGNGECKTCDTCTCFVDREGYQYFDHTTFCSDICMDTSRYGDCITNNTMGLCDNKNEHSVPLTMLPYNEKNINMYSERNISRPWIRCNDTFPVGKEDQCYVEYLASKNDMGFAVMVVQSCRDHTAIKIIATGAGGSKVPIILGVLALIAVVAAIAGFMLWKHFNSVPPMPFSSPDYQNIEAEDCVGENPIYKNPTTTFTNPQYGKC